MKIYADHAATTPVREEVYEAMAPYFKGIFGNPSSLYSIGREARKDIEESRNLIASTINADPEEIIFTSGGTESDNLAIQGIALANKEKGNHIITSVIEHHAVLNTCKFLEKNGLKVTYIDVDESGLINPKDVESAITDKTILVSIMHANNEVGTMQDIEQIGKICFNKKIYFHTDAVQTYCKIPIDVKKINLNLLSASAHKFYGPKGVGFLYVKKGTSIKPIVHGGNHESQLRSGTENVAGIVGMGKASELAVESMKEESDKERKLRDDLIKKLSSLKDSRLNGHKEKRLPGNVHFSFKGADGEALINNLDKKGIACSTGSACSSKSLEPSHVLSSIGLNKDFLHGSLRITLGKDNNQEDIDFIYESVKEIVENLRKISSNNS